MIFRDDRTLRRNSAVRIRPEPGNQIEGVASKDLSHDGHRIWPTPGAAFDQQAGGTICDFKRPRNGRIRRNRRNAVLRLGPWHMCHQPGSGRLGTEIGVFGLWGGIQKDMAVLQHLGQPVAGM